MLSAQRMLPISLPDFPWVLLFRRMWDHVIAFQFCCGFVLRYGVYLNIIIVEENQRAFIYTSKISHFYVYEKVDQ